MGQLDSICPKFASVTRANLRRNGSRRIMSIAVYQFWGYRSRQVILTIRFLNGATLQSRDTDYRYAKTLQTLLISCQCRDCWREFRGLWGIQTGDFSGTTQQRDGVLMWANQYRQHIFASRLIGFRLNIYKNFDTISITDALRQNQLQKRQIQECEIWRQQDDGQFDWQNNSFASKI